MFPPKSLHEGGKVLLVCWVNWTIMPLQWQNWWTINLAKSHVWKCSISFGDPVTACLPSQQPLPKSSYYVHCSSQANDTLDCMCVCVCVCVCVCMHVCTTVQYAYQVSDKINGSMVLIIVNSEVLSATLLTSFCHKSSYMTNQTTVLWWDNILSLSVLQWS